MFSSDQTALVVSPQYEYSKSLELLSIRSTENFLCLEPSIVIARTP